MYTFRFTYSYFVLGPSNILRVTKFSVLLSIFLSAPTKKSAQKSET